VDVIFLYFDLLIRVGVVRRQCYRQVHGLTGVVFCQRGLVFWWRVVDILFVYIGFIYTLR
jgi:hypothetical protein